MRENFDRCRSASDRIRVSRNKKRITNKEVPQKPYSSPMVQKIKSVCCSGTKLYFVKVPFNGPLPKRPPEPMAIFDCLTL